MTGQHSKTKKLHQAEAFKAAKRDEAQRDELILRRLQKQRDLAKQHEERRAKPQALRGELRTDLERWKALRENKRPEKPNGREREP